MEEKRRDSKGRLLRKGEWQRKDGRYTFCSRMAKAGMNPKTLQYIMGHSDITVTMNVYAHVQADDADEEMSRILGVQTYAKLWIFQMS